MAIDSTVRRVVYAGNGSRTSFPFTFKVFKASDVAVAVGTDTSSTLVYGTDYSVTLNANQTSTPGGTVTTAVAPASGKNLAIYSAVPITQPMVLTPYGGFNPETLNNSADRGTIIDQQLKEKLDRAIVVSETYTESPETLRDILLLGKAEAEKLLTSQAAIDRLYLSVGNIDTVKNHIGNVDAVASNKVNIDAVAGNAANINAVSANKANIDTTAQNINAVKTVSQHISNVNTVANRAANVDTVAGNISSINTVSANQASTNTVASHIANVNTVSGHIGNVDTVSSGITDVKTVAENYAPVRAVSNELTAVKAVAVDMDTVKAAYSKLPEFRQVYEAASLANTFVERAKAWAEDSASQGLATSSNVEITTSSGEAIASRTMVEILGGEYSSKAWAEIAGSKADAAASSASAVSSEHSAITAEIATASSAIASAKSSSLSAIASAKAEAVSAVGADINKAKTWAEGEDSAVEALSGEHSAKRWAEICKERNQADWTETSPGSGSFIAHKPSIDSDTSLTSTNAVSNKAITQRIEELWSHIYNNLGVVHLLNTNLGVDILTSSNEVLVADHP